MGVRTLILILIWSLVFDLPKFESLALYLDFEVEKEIHVLEVLIGTLEDSGGS